MRILENQSDFLHEKSQLKIEITKRGHECIFYLKFYCELNYIEYYWGEIKRGCWQVSLPSKSFIAISSSESQALFFFTV